MANISFLIAVLPLYLASLVFSFRLGRSQRRLRDVELEQGRLREMFEDLRREIAASKESVDQIRSSLRTLEVDTRSSIHQIHMETYRRPRSNTLSPPPVAVETRRTSFERIASDEDDLRSV
jgi:hypothetical protein